MSENNLYYNSEVENKKIGFVYDERGMKVE